MRVIGKNVCDLLFNCAIPNLCSSGVILLNWPMVPGTKFICGCLLKILGSQICWCRQVVLKLLWGRYINFILDYFMQSQIKAGDVLVAMVTRISSINYGASPIAIYILYLKSNII